MSSVPPAKLPVAITTVRIHWVTNLLPANNGQVACDFRCPLFVGKTQGDHHSTVHEWDVAPDVAFVGEVLEFGPIINKVLQGELSAAEALAGPLLNAPIIGTIEKFLGPFEAVVAGFLGGAFGGTFRLGIWDKIAPANDLCP